ncbi:TetR family transcriptional regulator [Sphingomonas sp. MM-1]|uniref:TetR/AcrR family transcriptional regulator n=1 Tax=Sphingomonas sp. MM-1 TaxID=745310 RepID=UPI0002C067E0|nr:TetR/AcrR family transcriptional regulator [Sphingomonas sp. MM-1]AGH50549.1 TetR family transcriptional regulator [Sphingomonas sp. MM-1]
MTAVTLKDRRDARRQDRRETILAVAARSFLEKGYAATSMSAIAATLGGSKGTLWSYFPSKEALFEAVLDHQTVAYRRDLEHALDLAGDLRETLTRFCRNFLEKVTSPDALALHRLVQAEHQRFPEVGRIFYERAPRATQRLLSAYLERCIANGWLRPGDSLRMARRLVGLCISDCHQRLMWGVGPASLPEAIEEDVADAVEIFIRAYAA